MTFFPAFPAQAAANAIDSQPLSPCMLSFSMLTRPGAQSQAVRLQLTLPEKPPLTKALSLLYRINSRVNKITYPQPNETGASQMRLGRWWRGSRADHTPPQHTFSCSPGTMVHSRRVTVQRTGVREPGSCPGSARHARNLVKSPQPLPAM